MKQKHIKIADLTSLLYEIGEQCSPAGFTIKSKDGVYATVGDENPLSCSDIFGVIDGIMYEAKIRNFSNA